MTITRISTGALIAWTAARFVPPATEEEAKELARRLNESEREKEAQRAREHEELMREIAPTARGGARARIDVSEIYRVRNMPAAERAIENQPRRLRSLHDLATSYYGPPSGDGLVPTGPRGGQR